MNKIAIKGISFADSEYEFFQITKESTLTIYMKSWKEDPFKIVFQHAIQFLYKLGDVPKGLYEISENSGFLQEALSREYINIPNDHPYKLFYLEDIDDFPFIQVVAESVSIVKE